MVALRFTATKLQSTDAVPFAKMTIEVAPVRLFVVGHTIHDCTQTNAC